MRYTFLLLFFVICISGQERYPAGLSKPLIWIKSEGKEQINLHPAFNFKERNKEFSWKLTPEQAEKYSLFIVYKNSDAQEQILWNLSQDKEQKLVATTQRINDYTASQHRIFPQKLTSEKVKIHYYQHYKKLSANSSQLSAVDSKQPLAISDKPYILNIGTQLQGFPPVSLGGEIAEIIVYDRVLSPLEMQQVASYLAIKYGVSLHQLQFRNYYNSLGNIIWDYQAHQEFNQNITAIGKDLSGNISQLQSQNSNDEQVIGMRFSLNKDEDIPNNQFVFWSDNGKDLEIKNQKEGQPKGITRIWQLDFSDTIKLPLNWYFNSEVLGNRSQVVESKSEPKSNNEQPTAYYWLVSDRSGNGDFKPESTTYVKLNTIESSKNVEIKDFLSATRISPFTISDQPTTPIHYTIWQAPELFAHLGIEKGKCQNYEEGKVHFNIIGGQAPYQIRVKKLEEKTADWHWRTSQNKGENPLKLTSGKYLYTITDAQNKVYSQEIFLTDEDAPNPQLNQEYLIKTPIVLDPKKDLPKDNYSFEWYKDNELISQNPSYLLSEKGDYELRIISSNGCKSTSKFKAFVSDKEEIKTQIVLYPNPSKDGHFSVMASFPKAVNGSLQIHSAEGRLIKEHRFYNEQQIHFADQISVSGVYFITTQTNLGKETKKLIVGAE